jgi:catechol 2,3-dioxygenase-like lactoylglutathione lyase family enzyme
MKLTFIYQSVKDLPAALAFYRDELGLNEAWREGESTVAFELPGSPVQLMLDARPDGHERWTSGAFFQVDDVVAFTKQHPDVRWVGEVIDLPDGRSASFADPSGNIVHIFDQQAQQAADIDQA